MMVRRRNFLLLGIILCLVGLGVVGRPVSAAEVVNQMNYRVPAETTIQDDVYVTASSVIIDGRIEGDLFIWGASTVEIKGEVTGDLLVITQKLTLAGSVGDDARFFADNVTFSGRVADDLNAWVLSNLTDGPFGNGLGFYMLPEAEVGGSLILEGGSAQIEGKIGQNLQAQLEQLQVAAQIGGAGELSGNQRLEISNTTRFTSSLQYSSPTRLNLDPAVAASIRYEEIVQNNFWGQFLANVLANLIAIITAGTTLIYVAFRPLLKPVWLITQHPWRCLRLGFSFSIFFIFLSFFWAFIILALAPLLSGLVPYLFVFIFLFWLITYAIWLFSPIITGLCLGYQFTHDPFIALLSGAFLILTAAQIQLVGELIQLTSFFLVIGAFIDLALLEEAKRYVK